MPRCYGQQVCAVEGYDPRAHLVQHDAHRVNVRLERHRLTPCLFG